MSDAPDSKISRIKPVERATNLTWAEWLEFMDGIGAKDLDHYQIAVKVLEELEGKIDSAAWWAQGVTIAYEQHIGRRIPGQRSDGSFQMNVSRATKLGMQKLMDAWVAFVASDPDIKELIATEPRIGGTDKRINWRAKAEDGSSIIVSSEPRPSGTASLVATQVGLESLELNEEAKAKWAAVLGRFLDGL